VKRWLSSRLNIRSSSSSVVVAERAVVLGMWSARRRRPFLLLLLVVAFSSRGAVQEAAEEDNTTEPPTVHDVSTQQPTTTPDQEISTTLNPTTDNSTSKWTRRRQVVAKFVEIRHSLRKFEFKFEICLCVSIGEFGLGRQMHSTSDRAVPPDNNAPVVADTRRIRHPRPHRRLHLPRSRSHLRRVLCSFPRANV